MKTVKKLKIQKLGGKWIFWDSIGFPFHFPSWSEAVDWMVTNEPKRRQNYVKYFEGKL